MTTTNEQKERKPVQPSCSAPLSRKACSEALFSPCQRRGSADRTRPKSARESRAASLSSDSSSAFPPPLPLIFSLPFSLPADKNQNSVTQYGGRTSERLSRDSAILLVRRDERELANRTMEES